jgi:hypothetical protein
MSFLLCLQIASVFHVFYGTVPRQIFLFCENYVWKVLNMATISTSAPVLSAVADLIGASAMHVTGRLEDQKNTHNSPRTQYSV